MKYNININQVALSKFDGIDLKDGAILSYIKDFSNSPKVEKMLKDDDVYYFISYSHMMKQMPLLKIKTKDGIYRRMKKLADAKIIKFHPENQKLGKPFFAFGENYQSIIEYIPYGQETVGVRMKNRRGYGQETVGGTDEKPNDNNTSNNNTSNNINSVSSGKKIKGEILPIDAEKNEPPQVPTNPPKSYEQQHKELMGIIMQEIPPSSQKAYLDSVGHRMNTKEFTGMVAEMVDHYFEDYGFKKNPQGFIKRKLRTFISNRKSKSARTRKPKNNALARGEYRNPPQVEAMNRMKKSRQIL